MNDFSKYEKILVTEVSNTRVCIPMTQTELQKRIGQSESDFENGRFKTSNELLAKYQ